MTTTAPRTPNHSIDSIFTARWSTRAFDGAPMPLEDLMCILEAARWAPSAYNSQPWRFVYAMRGEDAFARFCELLVPFNASWAARASALVFLLSDTRFDREDGTSGPAPSHAFDAGAAWAQLALQAPRLGYQAHAMGGLHFERARAELGIPERFALHIGIAIGRPAPATVLPAELRARETPTDRRPLAELVSAGRFGE